MWARIERIIHLTKGDKAVIGAYAAIMAVGAGLTLMIMSGVTGENAIPPEPTWYDTWVIVAGALGGAAGLFLARGWMGQRGWLGAARALVASIVVGCAGAVVAGSLILPGYGSVVAPVMLLTEFATHLWLAAAWLAVTAGLHALFMIRKDEETWGAGRAVAQLSRLSQVNLYRR